MTTAAVESHPHPSMGRGSAAHLVRESVQYASRIQRSLLPAEHDVAELMGPHFVVWEPRDVVGGDLYWLKADRTGYMLALFDCTGHGVPGALMTMIVVGALERAFARTGDPARLLRHVHQEIQRALKQDSDDGDADDGLDLGVCLVEPLRRRLTFCAGGLDLWMCDGEEVSMVRGDRASLGYRRIAADQQYTNHVIALHPGLQFYLCTDGVQDQVGGPKGRMFGRRRLGEALREVSRFDMGEQGQRFMHVHGRYQGAQARRDDLCIIGFKPLEAPSHAPEPLDAHRRGEISARDSRSPVLRGGQSKAGARNR